MEKTLLLQNIQDTRNSIVRIQGIHQYLDSKYKKPFKFGCFGHALAFIIYFFVSIFLIIKTLEIVAYPIDFILAKIFPEGFLVLMGTVLAYTIIILCAISYPYVFNKVNKYRLKKNEEIAKETDVINAEHETSSLLNYLATESYIPQDYHYLTALNHFEKYLKNSRADNLKECINLFEQERRHEEQIREIQIMQQMQEITYNRANEAVYLGWANLFSRRG